MQLKERIKLSLYLPSYLANCIYKPVM